MGLLKRILKFLGKEIFTCKHCGKAFLDKIKLREHQKKCKKIQKRKKKRAKQRRRRESKV